MSYEENQRYLQRLWNEFGGVSEAESFIDDESEDNEEGAVGEEEARVIREETAHVGEETEDREERSGEESEESREQSDDDLEIDADGNDNRYFLDKDKSKWSKFPNNRNARTRSDNIITQLPGVKGIARQKNTALDCWLLFFTEDMLDDIVRYTNVKLATKAPGYDANHQYLVKKTDKTEIKAVIGLLYLTGLYKANRQNIADLWNTDGSGIDLFRTTMSQQRYYILLQSLRFDNIRNRAQRKEIDKLAAIRGIFDHFVDNCKAHYTTSEYLTIDEKMEPFRGRVSFLQYIPNKPAKYGLKVFALVDAKTYYCLNMEVYVGTQPEGPFRQSNNPQDIVQRLIEPVSGTKRNITFDNWFTSYPLMINLLETHRLTSVGTVRKNKRQIPSAFLDIRTREPRSSTFAFKKDITAVSYVPRKSKNVILFSTLHHDGTIVEESRDKKLPEIIDFYNSTKGGVDTLDELSANYSVARNSRRWPLTLFFSFLNTAGVNAQVIYKSNTQNFNLKRRMFLKELGLQLISEFRNQRRQNPKLRRGLRESQPAERHEPLSKRRRTSSRCSVCPRNKDRKTYYVCMQCDIPLCLEHAFLSCENCAKLEQP